MAGALIPGSGEIRPSDACPRGERPPTWPTWPSSPRIPGSPRSRRRSGSRATPSSGPPSTESASRSCEREFALSYEEKALSKLSYGQRKKFALAAALAGGARSVLLDEPTNGLDIPSKMQFRKALAASVSEDRTIVVSTHQVRDLENLIDPILILDKGALAFELSGDEIASGLASARLPSLEGFRVVHAERDALGWNALVAREAAARLAGPPRGRRPRAGIQRGPRRSPSGSGRRSRARIPAPMRKEGTDMEARSLEQAL